MKKIVRNLNDALTFEMEGMYDVITGLQAELSVSLQHISNPSLRSLLTTYQDTLDDQRTKLKRIFGYLLNGPYDRKLKKVAGSMAQFKEINSRSNDPSIRALLYVSAMVPASQYKVSALEQARFLAIRLELDNVATLLDEMIDLEKEFGQTLRRPSEKQIKPALQASVVN